MTSRDNNVAMARATQLLVLWMTLSVTLTSRLTSDVFLSTAETGMLLESERRLLDFVHDCLATTAVRTGNSEFSRLATEAQREASAVPSQQDVRHPVDAYVGLRRFTQYWSKYIARLDPVVAVSVQKSLAQNRLIFPDEEVLHQARLAIVRLQISYNLTASQLLTSASSNLTGLDLGSLAWEAQLTGFPVVAEQWKRLRREARGDQENSSEEIPQRSPETNQEAVEQHKYQRRHARFFQLCQRLQNPSDVTGMRSERCVYAAGAFNPLQRWKVEVLNSEPYVALVYDFVTEAEVQKIVDKASVRLERALVGFDANDTTVKTVRRLGKIAWLTDKSDKALLGISGRIQEVTGLHTAYRDHASFGEFYQVVNYGIGGHYIPHHDYFTVNNAFSEALEYLNDSGDRAATFMIYLGDVSQGGATVFPLLGVGAPPIKRAALFWYNFSPDGLPDPRSLHGGCPVIYGQKWVANKWIHEISTAMTKSCKPHALNNT